jgi:diguanylate cyclase (GGDEF)-like protein
MREAWSVRAYLTAVIVVGSVLLMAGAAYAHHWNTSEARDDAEVRMSFQAKNAAVSAVESISAAQKSVTTLAAQPGLSKVFAGAPGCTLTFDGAGVFPSARLDLVAPDGTVACSSGDPRAPPPRRVHAGSEWLATALRAPYRTALHTGRDAVTQQDALIITAVVPGPSGAAGAVVAFYHLPPAADAMARISAGSGDVRFAVTDLTAGQVLSSPGHGRYHSVLEETAGLPRSSRTGTLDGSDDPATIFGSADIAGTSWRVFAGMPAKHAFAGAQGALWRIVLTGVLALLVLIGAAWRLNRSVARPLQAITAATREASKNLGSGRVAVQGTVETRELGRSFNAMLDVAGGHAAQLTYQATHDALTGLPNKALLMERAERALAAEQAVAILTLGMTRFRLVNDGLGHDVGDRVLREIAGRLQLVLRPTDTLARFSSDEFVILSPGVTADEALALAAALHGVLNEPFCGVHGDLSLSATIGLATGLGMSSTAAQLLRESDTAIRQAKRDSRKVQVFDPDVQMAAVQHLTLERELNQALAESALVLHYQPLVDVINGYVVGAEALVRWQHPQRGQIPPMDFIPLAEQTGQIVAIGAFVLREACEQAVRWALGRDALVVSVNVSAAQLRVGDFPLLVEQTLTETCLDPRQLCLENTESSLLTTSEQLFEDLRRLRAMGVHVAIDDFGTGYSSLSYLHELPCDELKIDRSFVRRLADDDSHLVAAILRMAQAMDLIVVAEGVETREQLELLASLGCQLGQGYLFSPAVPITEFQQLLSRRHAHTGTAWS